MEMRCRRSVLLVFCILVVPLSAKCEPWSIVLTINSVSASFLECSISGRGWRRSYHCWQRHSLFYFLHTSNCKITTVNPSPKIQSHKSWYPPLRIWHDQIIAGLNVIFKQTRWISWTCKYMRYCIVKPCMCTSMHIVITGTHFERRI